jgi:hypothetical protein
MRGNIVRDEWMDGWESIAQRDNRQAKKETTKKRKGEKAKGIKKGLKTELEKLDGWPRASTSKPSSKQLFYPEPSKGLKTHRSTDTR